MVSNPHIIMPLILSCLALVVSSTDIYIPNLPQMVIFFSTTENMTQMTITAAVIGSALTTPIIGALSDTLGRRPIVLFSLFTWGLATLGCSFSSSIIELMAWRFLQGMTGVAMIIMCGAIIADISKGRETGIRFAMMTTLITTSLVIAPLIGGYLGHIYDWRLSFWGLAALGLAASIMMYFLLPETHKNKHVFSPLESVIKYKRMLSHPRFLALTSIPPLLIGTHIGFIACAAFYYKEQLGYTQKEFGEIQSFMMLFNALSSFSATWFIHRWGEYKTVFWGLVISSLGAVTLVLAGFMAPFSAFALSLTFTIFGIGLGLVMPPLTGEAMTLFPESRGVAAAAMGIVRSLWIAAMITISTLVYTGSMHSITLLALGSIVAIIFTFSWLYRTRTIHH